MATNCFTCVSADTRLEYEPETADTGGFLTGVWLYDGEYEAQICIRSEIPKLIAWLKHIQEEDE